MSAEIKYLREQKAGKIDQLFGHDSPIIIVTDYKGLVLTQPVRIQGATPDRVILESLEPRESLTFKERVLLYSHASREIVSARVLGFNSARGKMDLTDLSLTGQRWIDRRYDRVQPRDPIYVVVKHHKVVFRACLGNLSVAGMSLMTSHYSEKALLEQNLPVRLTLQLPGEDESLEIKGKVVHIRRTGRQVIFGVHFMANSTQEKYLERYVMARKEEILAELDREFQEVCEQKYMPYIYC
jgi:hypothetical protein